jgi:large subunit ribosomal protein L23
MKAEKDIKKNNLSMKELDERYFLRSPHLSEKASILAEKGYYVFRVDKDSNKIQIKNEVEKKHKVDVLKVRIINIHPKKMRVGKKEGVKKGYKKAVVKIKEGQKIDLTSV